MSNPYNNHPNAKKWTVETVTDHLHAIEKEATDGASFFLGRILAKRLLYKQIWAYWKQTFIENDDIIEQMLRIETILEAKIIEGALKKEIYGPAATLTLKFNYSWNDKGHGNNSYLIHKNYQG
jgi:hypothetical protein